MSTSSMYQHEDQWSGDAISFSMLGEAIKSATRPHRKDFCRYLICLLSVIRALVSDLDTFIQLFPVPGTLTQLVFLKSVQQLGCVWFPLWKKRLLSHYAVICNQPIWSFCPKRFQHKITAKMSFEELRGLVERLEEVFKTYWNTVSKTSFAGVPTTSRTPRSQLLLCILEDVFSKLPQGLAVDLTLMRRIWAQIKKDFRVSSSTATGEGSPLDAYVHGQEAWNFRPRMHFIAIVDGEPVVGESFCRLYLPQQWLQPLRNRFATRQNSIAKEVGLRNRALRDATRAAFTAEKLSVPQVRALLNVPSISSTRAPPEVLGFAFEDSLDLRDPCFRCESTWLFQSVVGRAGLLVEKPPERTERAQPYEWTRSPCAKNTAAAEVWQHASLEWPANFCTPAVAI